MDNSNMKQVQARILKNKEIAGGFYRMALESKYLAKAAQPGQFVEVKCSDGPEPLLRRPLGVHRISKIGIELLYEVVGRGTELLAQKKGGELLDIIGPLGNGFNMDPGPRSLAPVLVAGGNGVAPLLFLAERLVSKNKNVHVLIGGRSKSHVLCEKDFKKLGANVKIATEDGSKGHKGLVTDLLNDFLRNTNDERRTTIYTCGPTEMLKTVAAIAREDNIPCQVSLEERMACGVGVCLGCPVKVKITGYGLRVTGYEYKMVCKDGPVFSAEEIAW